MKLKNTLLGNSFSLPYKIGGIKNITLSNPLIRSQYFEKIDNPKTENYSETDIFPYLILPARISNKVYKHIDFLYSRFLQDILNPKIFYQQKNQLKTSDNSKPAESGELESIAMRRKLYGKSFLNYMNRNAEVNEQVDFLDNLNKSMQENYEIFKYSEKKNLKNKIIFDKIFIHLNFSDNAFDLQTQKIKSISHSHSKSFYVFNYKEKTAPIAKQFFVRLSFWVKASNPLLICRQNDGFQTPTVYPDELHHILLEFEDNTNEMLYLNLFSKFSLVNFFRQMLDSRNPEIAQKNNINYVLKNLKICDFDFFVGENDRLSKSIDKTGYNEYFYIKYL